jgi:plasmid stability protein
MRKARGVSKAKLVVVTKDNYNETMANITIRNIPEAVFIKLKMLAEIDRRSLNNELLVAIEAGVRELEGKVARREVHVPADVRSALLKDLAGKWEDKRSTARIIKDIVASRTMGKDIKL